MRRRPGKPVADDKDTKDVIRWETLRLVAGARISMGLLFGAIADDLTGGLELAAMLRAEGIGCDFVSDTDALDPLSASEAIVVALRTRVAPRVEAVSRFEVAAAHLLKLRARQIFFKYCATFDSTNEGNIGPCADALVGATGARQTLFCPAFPEAGRRVFRVISSLTTN
jgi:3-dehydrotetronate 4-kinase